MKSNHELNLILELPEDDNAAQNSCDNVLTKQMKKGGGTIFTGGETKTISQ